MKVWLEPAPLWPIGYYRGAIFMTLRVPRAGIYALTSLTTLATFYHFSYLFFLLRDRFGYDDRLNLRAAALHGVVYVFAAWQGGRFAERRGYVTSLRVGFLGLLVSMAAGSLMSSAVGVLVVVVAYTVALLLIWPALEALATADVPPERVPHAVGVYNLTWSGSAAVAYFTGGPIYDRIGAHLVFSLPAGLFLLQCIAVWMWPSRAGASTETAEAVERVATPMSTAGGLRPRPARGVTFLRLAWLANPLSYVAIYTLLAVVPGLASSLGLTPTQAGLICSIWFFARLVSFSVLWRWTGWHYRFRFLVAGYVLLVTSFLAIVVAPTVVVLVVGQVLFGASAGLTYYSSLFYSMDLNDTKAEHGGLHEAGIGLGILAGPAVGTLSLQLWPARPHAGALAVAALLTCGLAAMFLIWRRGGKRR
jgi:predicted MFS family arabinose efflux permease